MIQLCGLMSTEPKHLAYQEGSLFYNSLKIVIPLFRGFFGLVSFNPSLLFQCVVGGCNATFASQGGLARHVPTHFSSQNSSKLSSQAKLKEESPSKAGISKRRKLKNKCRRSLRMYWCLSDFF